MNAPKASFWIPRAFGWKGTRVIDLHKWGKEDAQVAAILKRCGQDESFAVAATFEKEQEIVDRMKFGGPLPSGVPLLFGVPDSERVYP